MKNKKGCVWIFSGLLLIAAALFLTAYNMADEYRAQQAARQIVTYLDEYCPEEAVTEASSEPAETPGEMAGEPVPTTEIEIPDYLLNPEMDMPVQTIDGQEYIGVLRIPVLGLELPVISQWSYPQLKIAPCRYSGSAYLGDLIIAGHNYSAHFGTLKDLREGDRITFTDMDGNVFSYTVAFCEVLKSTDVEEMESGDWDLTLFTCNVSGQNRVTVRCVQEKAE